MDFAFTEDQELFRQTVRRFAERELLPRYAARENESASLGEVLPELAKLDLLGMRAPARYGGTELPFVTFGIAMEEFGRCDLSLATALLTFSVSCDLISRYGTEDLKSQWLPDLISGKRHVGFALTEPHCGSDAAALQTKAFRDGDHFVLTGEKSSVSKLDADACVVFARTAPGPGARGVSAFLVPLDAAGVAKSRFNDLGHKIHRRGALHLENVRVPATNLIGELDKAFYVAMNEFDYCRPMLALECMGAAHRSVDDTIEYVKTRMAFGKPIARFEGVSFVIAEAASEIEAVKLLCYKTLWLRDRGLPHNKEAAMVKWMGPELAVEVIHKMLLLHGHSGYTDDYPFGQRMRDAIGMELGDGTAQIMKLIVARELIGAEFRPH